jgi:4-hydroxy-3-polyprenylbenzoate decarboxylase
MSFATPITNAAAVEPTKPRRMVVGISGASGIAYGVKLLELLRAAEIETHLVVTKPAGMTRSYETDLTAEELRGLADVNHSVTDIGATIASGSFRTMGMIVSPCSVRTMGEIAYGTTTNLLTRAADVTLKERRRLVLMLRETPLTMTHLRAMQAVTESGGIIAPPVPAFYTRPQTIDDIVTYSVARVLDLFDIDVDIPRWDQHDATLDRTPIATNGRAT